MPRLLTIGHSNHGPEDFLQLVAMNDVAVVADVRSWPRSRHAEWASQEHLPELLRRVGCRYVFLGRELGGRPDGGEYYDADGHVLYGRVARGVEFREGLERLKRGAATQRVAAMCSEEDPTHCHRRLLIAKVLLEDGFEITHIRGDGALQQEEGISPPAALSLFDEEDSWWRSTRSVSRRAQPSISSVG